MSIFHSPDDRSFQLQHEGNVPVFVESATGKIFTVYMGGGGKLHVGDETAIVDEHGLVQHTQRKLSRP